MIVTLEGFMLSTGYLVKELTVLYDLIDYQRFYFESPENFHPTISDLRTIGYTEKHLNKFSLQDNHLLP